MKRKLYSKTVSLVTVTSGSRYVYGEKVPPGKIVHVLSMCVNPSSSDTNDMLELGVKRGSEHVALTSKAITTANDGMNIITPFIAGEGDMFYVYAPDANDSVTIVLAVNGIQYDVDDWEKLSE